MLRGPGRSTRKKATTMIVKRKRRQGLRTKRIKEEKEVSKPSMLLNALNAESIRKKVDEQISNYLDRFEKLREKKELTTSKKSLPIFQWGENSKTSTDRETKLNRRKNKKKSTQKRAIPRDTFATGKQRIAAQIRGSVNRPKNLSEKELVKKEVEKVRVVRKIISSLTRRRQEKAKPGRRREARTMRQRMRKHMR